MNEALEFGRKWLPRVSRSFAPSIAQLGDPLESSVGLTYLMCRVIDTVEDSEDLPFPRRRAFFEAFRQGLTDPDLASSFAREARLVWTTREGEDARLMEESGTLWTLFHQLPEAERRLLVPWIHEMAVGMEEYSARALKGPVVLDDVDDLHRYCHYVAGTVGGMLTDLFLLHTAIDPERANGLRARTEAFGQGLQMVNIAKDLARDHQRSWQFLPRSFCEGFDPRRLLDRENEEAVMAAHRRLCDLAGEQLELALEYTLLLPPHSPARRFCALPLLLARGTLRELRDNPEVLEPWSFVKVPREEALELMMFVAEQVHDDEALVARYARCEHSV